MENIFERILFSKSHTSDDYLKTFLNLSNKNQPLDILNAKLDSKTLFDNEFLFSKFRTQKSSFNKKFETIPNKHQFITKFMNIEPLQKQKMDFEHIFLRKRNQEHFDGNFQKPKQATFI